MKRRLLIGFALIAIVVMLGSAFVAAQNIVREEAASSRTGVSGPIEQGDFGFFHAAYVPVSATGISGPVEQGDFGFVRAAYLPVGRYGVSGPVEQGDTGF
jgi:hypothetical protein